MTASVQTEFNGLLAAIAASGAAGTFVILLFPGKRKEAVIVSVVVLLLALGGIGLVASLEDQNG